MKLTDVQITPYLPYLAQNPCVTGSSQSLQWEIGFWCGVDGDRIEDGMPYAFVEGYQVGKVVDIEEEWG